MGCDADFCKGQARSPFPPASNQRNWGGEASGSQEKALLSYMHWDWNEAGLADKPFLLGLALMIHRR